VRVHNEFIDHIIELPEFPRRIVSLSSGFTETLFAIGAADQVAAVSAYCTRYVDIGDRDVAGDYLSVDYAVLDEIGPDLIIATGGIQRPLALKLKERGYPVYALPLPDSFVGICDATIRLGALTGHLRTAREHSRAMFREAEEIRSSWTAEPLSVYAELWFGKHPRTIGGRTYIHDLIEIAGGAPISGDNPGSYLALDLGRVESMRPKVFLGFCEPEYPVDFAALAVERGWTAGTGMAGTGAFDPHIIVSDITKGRNLIHDGPSLLETSRWLQREMMKR
jgi:iron complex transport system substrate-binding protein